MINIHCAMNNDMHIYQNFNRQMSPCPLPDTQITPKFRSLNLPYQYNDITDKTMAEIRYLDVTLPCVQLIR